METRTFVMRLPQLVSWVASILFLTAVLIGCGQAPMPVVGQNPVFETDVHANDTDPTTGPPCDKPTMIGPQDCADGRASAFASPIDFHTLNVFTLAAIGGPQTSGLGSATSNNKVRSTIQLVKGTYRLEIRNTITSLSRSGKGHIGVMATLMTMGTATAPSAGVAGGTLQEQYDLQIKPTDATKIEVKKSGGWQRDILNPQTFVDRLQGAEFLVEAGTYTLQFELNAWSTADGQHRTDSYSEFDLVLVKKHFF